MQFNDPNTYSADVSVIHEAVADSEPEAEDQSTEDNHETDFIRQGHELNEVLNR